MKHSPQITAVLQAIFVTILWSSSWVLIKFGLRANLPALTFAGLRYALAFFCLAPFVLLNPSHRAAIKSFTRKDWGQLMLLGIVFYTLTQGSQFLSLLYLPAAMISLLHNLVSALVGFLGMIFLRENPSKGQWLGVALTVIGVAVYFLPLNIQGVQVFGLLIAFGGALSNAASSLLGRQVNRVTNNSPLLITFVSMGIGSLVLLVTEIAFQGFRTA
jgi:drug/metabolite transporter (DMT)-like permease